jgi:hypothetical protein
MRTPNNCKITVENPVVKLVEFHSQQPKLLVACAATCVLHSLAAVCVWKFVLIVQVIAEQHQQEVFRACVLNLNLTTIDLFRHAIFQSHDMWHFGRNFDSYLLNNKQKIWDVVSPHSHPLCLFHHCGFWWKSCGWLRCCCKNLFL